jgi:SDR family mycofactocin-dependent oxidoreductase
MTFFTRRRAIAAGTTALTGLAAAGTTGKAQTVVQQPIEAEASANNPTGRLQGKVAFITGAARGIGRAIALTLAREGANIVAFDIAEDLAIVPYNLSSENDLKRLGEDVRALGRKCLTVKGDVRDMAALRKAFARAIEELGGIDIVVANAGIDSASRLSEMSDAVWNDVVAVNLTGVANTFRAAIAHVVKRSQGRLVAISSEGGRRGSPGRSNYCAAKWGIIGLVKSAAQELAPQGITVNAICPGTVRTGMTQNPAIYAEILPGVANPSHEQIETTLREGNVRAGKLPLAFLEPEEIANAVLFLCSDEGRYVTGTALDITAGTSASYTA